MKMKIALFVIGILSAATLAAPAQAQTYPWCAQYSGDMGGAMNCGFVSFPQCMDTVRGIGGFCIENDWYHAPAGTRSSSAQRRLSH
jgi:Protein of unknown function (DUF3551)